MIAVLVVAATATGCAGEAEADRDAGATGPTGRYCALLIRFGELDLLYDEDPGAVRADLRALLALTRRAARIAPREIRVDAASAVTAQRRFNDLYAANGWDPQATNLDRDFIEFANSPELGALYIRLQEYQARVCGPDPRVTGPDVA